MKHLILLIAILTASTEIFGQGSVYSGNQFFGAYSLDYSVSRSSEEVYGLKKKIDMVKIQLIKGNHLFSFRALSANTEQVLDSNSKGDPISNMFQKLFNKEKSQQSVNNHLSKFDEKALMVGYVTRICPIRVYSSAGLALVNCTSSQQLDNQRKLAYTFELGLSFEGEIYQVEFSLVCNINSISSYQGVGMSLRI